MANVGTSAVRIIDSDNEVASVTSNALDVNIAGGTADIDIGDVILLLRQYKLYKNYLNFSHLLNLLNMN